VQDLDGEVLPLLTEHLLQFLLEDLACPVMGVDDVVADLEFDVDDLGNVEVFEDLLFCFCTAGNGWSSLVGPLLEGAAAAFPAPVGVDSPPVVRSAGTGRRG
jgi:hypothetical protein